MRVDNKNLCQCLRPPTVSHSYFCCLSLMLQWIKPNLQAIPQNCSWLNACLYEIFVLALEGCRLFRVLGQLDLGEVMRSRNLP